MKAASVKEIKSSLENLPPSQLLELCLRLVKFKKENKELATYILFDETDEAGYIKNVQSSLSLLFEDVNKTNPYFAKKTLRKIVRVANKFIRYSNEATTEVEVLLYVAESMRGLHLNWSKSTSLENIYLGVVKKIKKSVLSLHEDLQYDYQQQLASIEIQQ